MDIFDILWNLSQDEKIVDLDTSQSKTKVRTSAQFERLQEENRQLKIRIGVLIRLLIERGVFSAEDFHTGVTGTKAMLAAAALKAGSPVPSKVPALRGAGDKRANH
jgi:hypothetical protein